MIDYDFTGRNPPARDVSTFIVGAKLGGTPYISKTAGWNFDVSPRLLVGKDNNLSFYPVRYLALSTGVRVRL